MAMLARTIHEDSVAPVDHGFGNGEYRIIDQEVLLHAHLQISDGHRVETRTIKQTDHLVAQQDRYNGNRFSQ